MVDWNILWVVGAGGFFRAAVGWFKNSIVDGEIQSVEWLKLSETFVVYLGIGFLAMFGGEITEANMALVGLAAAFLVHEGWSAFQKKKTPVKTTSVKKKIVKK